MPKNLCFLLIVLAWAAAAGADEIVAGGIAYSNVKITAVSVADGKVSWEQASSGGETTTVSKDLSAIAKLSITEQDSYNQAEELLAKGKPADAVKAYDQALDRAGDVEWLKQLITVRRLKALGDAGAIDRAVGDWLSLMDLAKDSKVVLALAPSKVGARKSEANDNAIKALEGKLGDKKGPAIAAMQTLLMRLYEAQGNKEKAQELANKIGGGTPTGTGDSTSEKIPEGASIADQLKVVEFQIKSGNAKQAVDLITGRLKDYSPAELPKALLLMGKAQAALAAKAADKGEKAGWFKDAGLSFMRVATFYPTTIEAAESIYLAGTIHRELGNRVAARAAFNKALTYAESPFAAKATEAIQEMEKSGAPGKEPAKTPSKDGGK